MNIFSVFSADLHGQTRQAEEHTHDDNGHKQPDVEEQHACEPLIVAQPAPVAAPSVTEGGPQAPRVEDRGQHRQHHGNSPCGRVVPDAMDMHCRMARVVRVEVNFCVCDCTRGVPTHTQKYRMCVLSRVCWGVQCVAKKYSKRMMTDQMNNFLVFFFFPTDNQTLTAMMQTQQKVPMSKNCLCMEEKYKQ